MSIDWGTFPARPWEAKRNERTDKWYVMGPDETGWQAPSKPVASLWASAPDLYIVLAALVENVTAPDINGVALQQRVDVAYAVLARAEGLS